MNKLINELVNKKVADKVNSVVKAAEEEITMSRKVFGLEIAVAILGGIVFGMLISPRKKVSYKIASNNHDIGDFAGSKHCTEEYDEDEDENEEDTEDDDDNGSDEAPDSDINGKSKFIKL
ncbi:MAG: hypothetical protein II820_02860 [Ruminiclostridium sp.]|nr:hypothetical protein [Ruminiclostridium sp.]